MNSFIRPGGLGGGDRGFQINDPQIDFGLFELRQQITPDIIETYRSRDRPVRFLGKIDIFARVANARLVQNRLRRMRQCLIDATAGHDVAAEKQTHEEA